MAHAQGPLAGLTVVDLTRVLSGPYCTMMLADMGARVIKVERPGKGDDTRAWGPPFQEGESSYFLSVNRNKESLTLDFKHPAGRDILERLVARADVLVENFRPGTLDKLGFDYASVAMRHPRLVYCSISGFGQTGPRREEPGYDAVMQGEGGLMSITGSPDGKPYRLGVAIADIASGMFAAHGVVLALYARERSGRGQLVDLGMLDAVAALLTYQAGACFATGTAPSRLGNQHPTIAPYETFAASDGDVVVAVGNDGLWADFCAVMDLEALVSDERFSTNPRRVANRKALNAILDARFSEGARAGWIERLTAAGVPCGSVRTVAEALADPQLLAREMVVPLAHAVAGPIQVTGVPIKLSDTPGTVRRAPPVLGADTDAVLGELGYTPDAIDGFRRARVIQ